MLVHRVVAQAFLPNPDDKKCVNHIDGNRYNNNVDNLEWTTHAENMHSSRRKCKPTRQTFLCPINRIYGEIWKDVPNYEDVFQASNFGRIKRKPRVIQLANGFGYIKDENIPEYLVPTHSTYDGYRYISFNIDKKKTRKTLKVHRVIAQTFLPNTDNKPCVNHKNGVRNDNRLENLEWVTYSENSKHAIETGLCTKRIFDENHPQWNDYKEKVVNMWQDALNTPNQFRRELAKKYNISDESAKEIFKRIKWASVTKNLPDPVFSNRITIEYRHSIKKEPVADLEGEVWKQIKGYKYRYYISNLGRAKKVEVLRREAKWIFFIVETLLKVNTRTFTVDFTRTKNPTSFQVAMFVALNFVDNPNNYKYVMHIDNDISNNKTSNLMWVPNKSYADNLILVKKVKTEMPSDDIIQQIIEKYESGKYIDDIIKETGITECWVKRCCKEVKFNKCRVEERQRLKEEKKTGTFVEKTNE
jgi:hypothetical protein